jgi:hypothetical protein
LHQSKKVYGFTNTVVGLGMALLTFSPLARGNIVINAVFDSTITSDVNAASIESTINQAVSFYESNIVTPVTVTVHYSEMTSGLGQSSTFFSSITYNQYLAALQTHTSGDAIDTAALASLPAGPDNPVNGSRSMDLALPNLRALGFSINPPAGQADSTVSVNTSITNYGGNFNSNFFSLLAVVEHETDEALGTGSNLDSGSTTGNIRPEDLFRYSAPGVRSYTTSPSATSYLSVNGGVTNLVGFNQTGPPGGADYGDWAGSGTPRVQDAFGTPGASAVFGVDERDALDATGYNFTTATVPEPSSFWLLALGAVGFIGYRRLAAS